MQFDLQGLIKESIDVFKYLIADDKADKEMIVKLIEYGVYLYSVLKEEKFDYTYFEITLDTLKEILVSEVKQQQVNQVQEKGKNIKDQTEVL